MSVGKCPGLVRVGQVLGASGVLCTVFLYVPQVIHFVGRQEPKLALSRRLPSRSLISRSRMALPSGEVPSAVFQAKAGLSKAVLYCPPTICEWQGGWASFKTGAIMQEGLSPAALYVWKKTLADKVQRSGL